MEQKYAEITRVKLEEIKPLVKLFGLDYDGTVSDAEHKQPEVFGLVEKILAKDKSVAFITARAATAIKVLYPPMQELMNKQETAARSFIAGGNGTTLYEVKKEKLVELYNRGLELPQVLRAVEIGREVYNKLGLKSDDLAPKGLETFRKFLQDSWEGYVPADIIDICRPYNGELFTEQAKVTFVLPKDKALHKKLVGDLNEKLGHDFSAAAGDETYVHITRHLEEDSKMVAIKTILERLGLESNEVATFGDMPLGNDAGLLSFPYSFTNSTEFAAAKNNLQAPPYVLSDPDLTPVGRVYKVIECLLL